MEIITRTKDNLGHEHTLFEELEYNIPKQKEKKIRGPKDEIVTLITEGLNKENAKKNWQYTDKNGVKKKLKPATERGVAIKINRHPNLKHSIDECWFVYNKCEADGYWFFNWITKGL